MSKKFYVTVTQTRSWEGEIEAANEEDAKDYARDELTYDFELEKEQCRVVERED